MVLSFPAVRRGLREVALVMAGAVVVITIGFALVFPWDYGLGLWSTLTGRWVGQVTMPDGQVSPVYLDLQRNIGDMSWENLEGKLRWCDDTSASIVEYGIHGDTENWLGTSFHFSTEDGWNGRARMRLHRVQGKRSGGVMKATGTLVAAYNDDGTENSHPSSHGTPRQVQYELRRGRERDFIDACKRTPGHVAQSSLNFGPSA
jgi:hypothetical protein